jgi:hypothetical protein
VSATSLTVFGVSVQLTTATQYEDEDDRISAEQFLARAPGAIVEVDGTWTGAAIVADEAEIEHD